ncbi:MAG: hypothetical protein ACYCSG_04070 [Thermoplasmataceae archaeon]
MKVVILNDDTLHPSNAEAFQSFVLQEKPKRIIVIPGTINQIENKQINILRGMFEPRARVIPLVERSQEIAEEDEVDVEAAIKSKVLDLGLRSVRDYVSDYLTDINALNSEITYTLYRAYFKFYVAALGDVYTEKYERRRRSYQEQIIALNPTPGDILLTSEEDAYWYVDNIIFQ